jgi:hypothetical protein
MDNLEAENGPSSSKKKEALNIKKGMPLGLKLNKKRTPPHL